MIVVCCLCLSSSSSLLLLPSPSPTSSSSSSPSPSPLPSLLLFRVYLIVVFPPPPLLSSSSSRCLHHRYAPTRHNLLEPTRHRHGVRRADTAQCRRHGLCRVGDIAPTCRHVCRFWGKKSPTRRRHFQQSLIYPCPYWGQSIFVTVGNYIVSNQLIAGSIMVRHMIFIFVLSLPLRVYYLMRCTHNAIWGVILNSFDSTISYFGCVSCFWQDLQDLMLLDGMCHTSLVLHRFCCLLET